MLFVTRGYSATPDCAAKRIQRKRVVALCHCCPHGNSFAPLRENVPSYSIKREWITQRRKDAKVQNFSVPHLSASSCDCGRTMVRGTIRHTVVRPTIGRSLALPFSTGW